MMRVWLLAALLATFSLPAPGGQKEPPRAMSTADSPPAAFPLPPDPDELLPPDVAFPMSIRVEDARTIVARFAPAAGYYLYRDKFAFKATEPAGVKVANVDLPAGERKNDPFFGDIRIFRNPIRAVVRLGGPSAALVVLDIAYQGCNDRLRVCYPPIRKTVRLALPHSTRLEHAR